MRKDHSWDYQNLPPSFFSKEGTDVAKKWIAKIRRDPGSHFVINKHTKICSNHFTTNDFVATVLDYPAARCHLKPNAVPSIFPWTTEVSHRISIQHHEYISNDDDICVAEPSLQESDDCSGDDENCENGDCKDLEEMDALCSQTSDIQALKLQIQLLQDSLDEAKMFGLEVAVPS